jgi:hypothetical protein
MIITIIDSGELQMLQLALIAVLSAEVRLEL